MNDLDETDIDAALEDARGHHRAGRLAEAEALYRRVLDAQPGAAEVLSKLAAALAGQGKLDDAVASYLKARDINPDFPDVHNNLGKALRKMGRPEEAVDSYHQALAVKADYADAHYNLGLALQDLGKLEDAAASYRKALAIEPGLAEAHRLLAVARKFSAYDNDIKAMEDTYAMPGLEDEQRMHLAFGLGKSFEDLRQYEKAFGFFLTGNAIKRGTYDFSMDSVEDYFGNLKKLFTKNIFTKHQRAGSSDETPLFVLGMVRSGTTLVEQILASHPKVHGAGEVDYLSKNVASNFSKTNEAKFIDRINQASSSHFSAAGGEYISLLREHSHTAKFITDKTPHFELIGMIKLMLPKAKVIHCCRDPRDTCLSIFKNYFTVDGHYYAYDLSDLGRYYNLYRDLMNHWQSVLPDFIYHIQYEDVVADQEKQSRALLAYCGLEWDDACLEFYKTDRPVQTASAVQVRRPIYKDSVQSWKRYENHLGPLLEVL